MDQQLKDHIKQKLPQLLKTLSLNIMLLAHLESESVLDDNDLEKLEVIGRNQGKFAQLKAFFDILYTKPNYAYKILMDELSNTSHQTQFKVTELLQEGWEQLEKAHVEEAQVEESQLLEQRQQQPLVSRVMPMPNLQIDSQEDSDDDDTIDLR